MAFQGEEELKIIMTVI